jgi:hypothetical protein
MNKFSAIYDVSAKSAALVHRRTRNELECAVTCITIDAAATQKDEFLLDCIQVLVRCAGAPKGVDGTGSRKFVASLGAGTQSNLRQTERKRPTKHLHLYKTMYIHLVGARDPYG